MFNDKILRVVLKTNFYVGHALSGPYLLLAVAGALSLGVKTILHDAGMNLANGHTQGVGGVVGSGNFIKVKQNFDHFLHLFFVGFSITGYSGFSLGGTEFADGFVGIDGGQCKHAARLSHGDAGGDVLFEVEALNGDRVGLKDFEEAGSLLEDSFQALCKMRVRRGVNRTMRHMVQPASMTFHDTISCSGGAGIETDDPH